MHNSNLILKIRSAFDCRTLFVRVSILEPLDEEVGEFLHVKCDIIRSKLHANSFN
jgi:hypothetical protein